MCYKGHKFDFIGVEALDNANLKKAGLKVTLPRVKILEILENAKDHHLSAEDVYRVLLESAEDIGLATVYRVLTQFEEAGLVVRHNFEGGHSVFELDHGHHHDHLVCVKCGKVEEFIDPIIEERQQEIAKKAGYTITDHSLNIYGICGVCQQQ
jgi:Fur family ferric uptake transcriptional regulator